MLLDRTVPNEFLTFLYEQASNNLRIGQVFENLRSYAQQEFGIDDLFYVENDKLVTIIESWKKNR